MFLLLLNVVFNQVTPFDNNEEADDEEIKFLAIQIDEVHNFPL